MRWCGVSRLIAIGVSFALCLAYLLALPFHPAGLAALLGAGTLILMALDRRDDIITTGITTTVVMVVGALSPQDAWRQPLLRLADTRGEPGPLWLPLAANSWLIPG
jgi:hypothetical protein